MAKDDEHNAMFGIFNGKCVIVGPHAADECDRIAEQAEQFVYGHETVYEHCDAPAVRASVGYSKSYAKNFDSVFGKN